MKKKLFLNKISNTKNISWDTDAPAISVKAQINVREYRRGNTKMDNPETKTKTYGIYEKYMNIIRK